jgi:hypothetical protein
VLFKASTVRESFSAVAQDGKKGELKNTKREERKERSFN